jgi:quercetin dioxygenase-like cupin family protein
MKSMPPCDFRECAGGAILMRRRNDRLPPVAALQIQGFKETAMLNIKTKLGTAAIAVAAAASFSTPAIASSCASPGVNDLATDTVLSAINLGPEINVDGRQLRTRRLVVQPGGIVPLHSHKDRPALIYTISGSITEYSSACAAPIQHKAGDISREADGLSHYWVNHGKVPAVLLSSDVFHGM